MRFTTWQFLSLISTLRRIHPAVLREFDHPWADHLLSRVGKKKQKGENDESKPHEEKHVITAPALAGVRPPLHTGPEWDEPPAWAEQLAERFYT